TQILYQSTVLNSLEETENALVNYSQEQERRDRLQAAVSQNQTALELSRELYTSGLGDFLAVLDAQRQLYGNEDLSEPDCGDDESERLVQSTGRRVGIISP